MSEELQRLRDRVAVGAATDEERDELAAALARAVRQRGRHPRESIEDLLTELRGVADLVPERPACTDALAGALLDAQIRAFERRDVADAWSRLDEIRARLIRGGAPEVLHDRLAAALFNTHRGGELLDVAPMRAAALEELRTRAYVEVSEDRPLASVLPCRVALAEVLANAIEAVCRRRHQDDGQGRSRSQVWRDLAELEGLVARDASLELARELGRAKAKLFGSRLVDPGLALAQFEQLVARYELSPGDPLERSYAQVLVYAHADALREDDELGAEALRERLGTLARRATGGPDERPGLALAVVHEWGKALHDAAVLGQLGAASSADAELGRGARALRELRTLVDGHGDAELRSQLMSALFQVHRAAVDRRDIDLAQRLQAEADALRELDESFGAGRPSQARNADARAAARAVARIEQARAELRLDHLRMLLATHASAGDSEDYVRAEHLLGRARALVIDGKAPIAMLEVFGQMLVNAHVDAGARAGEHATGEQPLRARALLVELRELAQSHPRSSGLQLNLATALFNAHVGAGQRRMVVEAGRLITELDALHRAHPGLLELRRRVVMALVNHHGDALDRDDLDDAGRRLDRVRELVRSPDADDSLRLQLAMALGNTLAHVDDAECQELRDRTVDELRILAGREDASDTLRALVLDELSDRFAPLQ